MTDTKHDLDHLDDDKLTDPPNKGGDGGQDDDLGDDDPSTPEEKTEARKQGWRSEGEWDEARAQREGRQKPKRFLTAKEFLQRGENEIPLLRNRAKKLESELERLNKKTDEQGQFIKEQAEFHKKSLQRVREDERAKLRAEQKAAAAEGDVERLDKANEALDQLHEDEKKEILEQAKREAAPPADDKAKDPVVDGWVGENPWFTAKGNKHINLAMVKEYENVVATKPTLGKRDQLEAAKRKIMQRFPETFGIEPSRAGNGGSVHESTNRRGNDSPESRFSRLPKADQEIYQKQKSKFADLGTEYTVKEFLENYPGA